MAHQVTFSVPERPLERKDIEFDVKTDGEMLGTLKVRRGGIVWRQKNYTFGYYLTWEKFDETLERHHTSRRAL